MENRGKELAQRGEQEAQESRVSSSESTERSVSMDASDAPLASKDLEPGTVLTDDDLESVFGGVSLDWEIDW